MLHVRLPTICNSIVRQQYVHGHGLDVDVTESRLCLQNIQWIKIDNLTTQNPSLNPYGNANADGDCVTSGGGFQTYSPVRIGINAADVCVDSNATELSLKNLIDGHAELVVCSSSRAYGRYTCTCPIFGRWLCRIRY